MVNECRRRQPNHSLKLPENVYYGGAGAKQLKRPSSRGALVRACESTNARTDARTETNSTRDARKAH